MGKNGVYAFDRVFPPQFKCIKCKHPMIMHNRDYCNISNCICEISNPTFKFIIKSHVATVEMIVGGHGNVTSD